MVAMNPFLYSCFSFFYYPREFCPHLFLFSLQPFSPTLNYEFHFSHLHPASFSLLGYPFSIWVSFSFHFLYVEGRRMLDLKCKGGKREGWKERR